jgi:hypothetical protein
MLSSVVTVGVGFLKMDFGTRTDVSGSWKEENVIVHKY